MKTRIIAWITSAELAHKFLELARTLDIDVEVPRTPSISCEDNTIVVTDKCDIARDGCNVVCIEGHDVLESLLSVLSILITSPSEILVGVDLGKDKLAYVVMAAGSVIDYDVCTKCLDWFASRICRIASRNVFVGIGYTPAVALEALRLRDKLRACGVVAEIVDERESNRAPLLGLRGSNRLRKSDLRAAAIMALRSRFWRKP